MLEPSTTLVQHDRYQIESGLLSPITGTIKFVPSHLVNNTQTHIWRPLLDFQINERDLERTTRYEDCSSSIDHQATFPIMSTP